MSVIQDLEGTKGEPTNDVAASLLDVDEDDIEENPYQRETNTQILTHSSKYFIKYPVSKARVSSTETFRV